MRRRAASHIDQRAIKGRTPVRRFSAGVIQISSVMAKSHDVIAIVVRCFITESGRVSTTRIGVIADGC